MKKGFIMTTVIIALLCSSMIYAGELERIREAGEIVVSLNKQYAPFCMEMQGQIIGFDVELAQLIGEALGVKVRFIIPDLYNEQIPKLLAGESDIIIAAMTMTVERGLQVNFTQPYFEVSQAALVDRAKVPSHVESYFELTEISGLTIGLKAHTTIEQFARDVFPAEALKTYPTVEEAANALAKGEVDAMVHDSPFVQVWAKTHADVFWKIKPLLAPVTKEYYGFAIRKGDQDFLNWLNLFIRQISADGTLDLLKYTYFTEMAWLRPDAATAKPLTRAQLLKNRFLLKKQEELEQLLQQEQEKLESLREQNLVGE